MSSAAGRLAAALPAGFRRSGPSSLPRCRPLCPVARTIPAAAMPPARFRIPFRYDSESRADRPATLRPAPGHDACRAGPLGARDALAHSRPQRAPNPGWLRRLPELGHSHEVQPGALGLTPVALMGSR
ncbi:hypothetical protein GCM10010168_37860 [Actinoplanes ianthinogenes]|uniref:Uncharacterized protein n=1 Tax=Actinoplanes ianthinogenes TaxID=122358 RepID=A0ABN6CNC1_9ACTN|nr:hypothetical protein Aiant_73490 [Actinoplanes ianthinogenes]GGR16312.1 hypothetical protein GCM10010168_37860 [Actinoplanes ianthinogenes]